MTSPASAAFDPWRRSRNGGWSTIADATSFCKMHGSAEKRIRSYDGAAGMTNKRVQRSGFSWQRPVLLLCALTLAGAHCAAAGAASTSASGAQRISAAQLLLPAWSGSVIPNTAFIPASDAVTAHQPFLGTLQLTEAQMSTQPAVFSPRSVLGRDPRWFPGVALSFFTDKGDLVPFTQDVIRYGSTNQGRSYWDIIVQPGRRLSRHLLPEGVPERRRSSALVRSRPLWRVVCHQGLGE